MGGPCHGLAFDDHGMTQNTQNLLDRDLKRLRACEGAHWVPGWKNNRLGL